MQVGEVEMEEIVKIGRSGMEARNLVGGEDGDSASGNLLGEYDGVGFDKARMPRTPRVAETRMFRIHALVIPISNYVSS